MDNNNKPKHLSVLKAIGIIGIIITFIGLLLVFVGFGNDPTTFMIGGFIVTIGFSVAPPCLIVGFKPEIAKLKAKTTKYIQNENKEDFKEIASNTAEIASDAVTTTVKAVKKGMTDTKFCTECGKELDATAKFCSNCGKEQ